VPSENEYVGGFSSRMYPRVRCWPDSCVLSCAQTRGSSARIVHQCEIHLRRPASAAARDRVLRALQRGARARRRADGLGAARVRCPICQSTATLIVSEYDDTPAP